MPNANNVVAANDGDFESDVRAIWRSLINELSL